MHLREYVIMECIVCNLITHSWYKPIFHATLFKSSYDKWMVQLSSLFNDLNICTAHRRYIERIPFNVLGNHFLDSGNLLCKFNKCRIETSVSYQNLIRGCHSLNEIYIQMQKLLQIETFRRYVLTPNPMQSFYCCLLDS